MSLFIWCGLYLCKYIDRYTTNYTLSLLVVYTLCFSLFLLVFGWAAMQIGLKNAVFLPLSLLSSLFTFSPWMDSNWWVISLSNTCLVYSPFLWHFFIGYTLMWMNEWVGPSWCVYYWLYWTGVAGISTCLCFH